MQPVRVAVPVATLWASPESPRPVDRLAVQDEPDLRGWLAELESDASDGKFESGRLGLHGRVLTQLADGEPVFVVDEPYAYPGWVRVVCPWQPSSLDASGYPGWLRRAHLASARPGDGAVDVDRRSVLPPPRAAPEGRPELVLARRHLGLAYLWGGTSAYGLDCSGLVHVVHRELGRVVPRDAHDQQAACRRLSVEKAEPGDLYFFGRPGRPVHHVGMVTEPGRMIHAAEGRCVVEEDLTPDRLETLTAAGRVDRQW